jgi:hypothetical protein
VSTSLAVFLEAPAAEKPWPPQVTHLSQSSIGMLFRCPRQFERRYLHGEKERPGESLVVGSFFHDTLNFNYTQKVSSHTDRPINEVVQYLQDEVVPKVIEEEGGEDNIRWDSGLPTARSDAERILAAYYFSVVPRIQPIGTEAKFEIDFATIPVPIVGYVDVWEQGRTLDTKTGKQAVRKIKPSWALQGKLYSWATGRPTEYHSISRAKTPTIVTALESEQLLVPVPTRSQKAELEHAFNTAAAMISFFYDRFGIEGWPTFGAIPDFTRNMLPCDFCGWRQGCPAWR